MKKKERNWDWQGKRKDQYEDSMIALTVVGVL